MVVEIDPGTEDSPAMQDGGTIPLANTKPNINPDSFLAMLDADTRNYLQLLLQGGAEGLGDRGRQLSGGLRRFEPFTRYIAELNGALDRRRQALARVVHDFRLLSEELARNDQAITHWVSASSEALGGFANQQQSIQDALVELPATLRTARSALDSSNQLSTALQPTLQALLPQAEALGPGLEASAEFFRATTPTLAEQLRPFAKQVRPVVRDTRDLADPLNKTVTDFGGSLTELNYGLNELAFNPGTRAPGFLFYLPWLNHNLNAGYTLQDGMGPLRRGMVMLTCNSTYLAGGFVPERPSLNTVYQATNIPTADDICP
jgi:phospholipid/cholesterol/gamma-HCH transport system substrate-binding protein